MYTRLQLAQKYLHYYLTASNGKGHGIHSPFVYDFVRRVLNDNEHYPAYSDIENLRRQLKRDRTVLEMEDLGAGSAVRSTRHRTIADLALHAAKPPHLAQLLFRIARYYQPSSILELGTSLGLSTAYLAAGAAGNRAAPAGAGGGARGGAGAKVFSIEGSANVAAVAASHLRSLGLGKTELVVGNFDDVLQPLLDRIGEVGLGFVDGNHRCEPTLRYLNMLIGHCNPSSVLIFDDIHWSREMEEAWATIRQDSRVRVTIDLFFIGLVFFREESKVKQDFVIRF
jgi:predicted O-methyltransferase YrrM